jgi:hypothetical protein
MNKLPETSESPDRRMLIRDVLVFQFKLIVDGLRDFFLVPVAFFAGLLSFVNAKDGVPGPHFYNLLQLGKQSEEWIDLFGAMRNAPPEFRGRVNFPEENMDQLLNRLETFVVDEERRGGITAQARERLEKALRGFQNR